MKLIILDRDGVINHDSQEYIKSPQEWHLIAGSDIALAQLKQNGYTIAVATNQSGVSRGYFDESTLGKIHQKMYDVIEEAGGEIDFLVYCPHGPAEKCYCRKPKPGLYLQISEFYQCELVNVPVIGDSLRDLQAAKTVGAKGILVLTGKGQQTLAKGGVSADIPVFPDLLHAVTSLIEGKL